MNKGYNTIYNFFWRFSERFLAQIVGFVVSIILARMLEPSVYGTIAIVLIFTNILQVFVDGGFGLSLIQKDHLDDEEISSVFWFNLFFCTFLYLVLFAFAPFIGILFNNQELVMPLRILGLSLIFSGFKCVPQALMSRNMQFKQFFFITIIGTIIAAIVGIIMAFYGFGIWALVFQFLINGFFDTVFLWIFVKWKPLFAFNFQKISHILSFGWKVLLNNLISSIYTNSRQFIIGLFYNTEDLAYYNKANEFPNKIVPNIESSVNSVLLPRISKEQNNLSNALDLTRKSIQIMSFIVFPMMLGMAAVSSSLIIFLLSDNWINCSIYLKVFCIEAMIWPLSSILNNTINAIGKPSLTLMVQTITRIIGILSLLLFSVISPFFVALCALFNSILEFILIINVSKKAFRYSFLTFFKDIWKPLIASILMFIAVSCFSFESGAGLFFQICLGILVYFSLIKTLFPKLLIDFKYLFGRKKK